MTHDKDAVTGIDTGADADEDGMTGDLAGNLAAELAASNASDDRSGDGTADRSGGASGRRVPAASEQPVASLADRQDPTRASDEALLAMIAADASRPAFVVLFDRYAGRVKAFFMAAGASHEEAEEGVQEVMVTLWRQARQFNAGRGGATTWIYTIARNKRIDLIRRQRRPAPDPQDPLFAPDPIRGAEHEVAHDQRDTLVRRALSALSEDQLVVIRLSFFAGMSQSEIANELGTPLGTVKSRLRLSFQRLREALGEEFQGELLDE
ncbi:MAG: sigma-70 family RNA polymerase sigma factor [Pseudomonadota bacterium]